MNGIDKIGSGDTSSIGPNDTKKSLPPLEGKTESAVRPAKEELANIKNKTSSLRLGAVSDSDTLPATTKVAEATTPRFIQPSDEDDDELDIQGPFATDIEDWSEADEKLKEQFAETTEKMLEGRDNLIKRLEDKRGPQGEIRERLGQIDDFLKKDMSALSGIVQRNTKQYPNLAKFLGL